MSKLSESAMSAADECALSTTRELQERRKASGPTTVVHARVHVERLAKHIQEAIDMETAPMIEALRLAEDGTEDMCPCCGGSLHYGDRHTLDCLLDNALKEHR